MSEDRQPLNGMLENLRRYITLNIDYARLTAAEKVSVLLSTVTFYAVMMLMGTLALIFLSLGIGHLLSQTIAPIWSYLIVTAFYIILLVVLFIFRRKLFVDPITRFVTKLFVKPPKD